MFHAVLGLLFQRFKEQNKNEFQISHIVKTNWNSLTMLTQIKRSLKYVF